MRVAFWILCALLAAWASENLYEGFRERTAMHEALPAHHAGAAVHSFSGHSAERGDLLGPADR